jgi:hypothetical protein
MPIEVTVPVVPAEDLSTLEEIRLEKVLNPYDGVWWASQSVTGVPESVMGWLVAQGWEITAVAQDATTVPPTIYYSLGKMALQPFQMLLTLCNHYTIAAQEARSANEQRYNETMRDWKELVGSTQTHFQSQVDSHNAYWGLYLTDLDTYMGTIEEAIRANRDDLGNDYGTHKTTTRNLLLALGATEVARINEQFASSLSEQLQRLIDQGLYSAAVAVDITARNHRDRDEQLQKHYDALAREKLGNEHQLYAQRTQLAEHYHKVIAEQMNTSAARLEGWKSVADQNRQLMAYQIDTKNALVVGLYGFIERREDVAPEWKDMVQMIAGLGDSAGGWITP